MECLWVWWFPRQPPLPSWWVRTGCVLREDSLHGGGCPAGALAVLVLLAHRGELDEERQVGEQLRRT